MSQDEIVKKNFNLHAEWMRYCFEHPEVLDQIPQGAQLVILPDNEPALAAENNKILTRLKVQGLPLVIVHLDLPKPPMPKIEIVSHS